MNVYDKREIRSIRIELENIANQLRWIEEPDRVDFERQYRFIYVMQGAHRVSRKARNAARRFESRL